MTQATAQREGAARMAALLLSVEPDEMRGLRALAEVDAAATGDEADVTATARAVLRAGLEMRLDEKGLRWSPAPEAVRKRAAEAARPDGMLLAFFKGERVRRYGLSALLCAVLVVLWGGYVYGWQWTGFQANEQLWDWLRLLLLPVVVGTMPLWLRHSDYLSAARRRGYVLVGAAFAVFVAVGYLVPLDWTGFPGNTLWSWLSLLALPAAVASAKVLPAVARSLRPRHKWVITTLAAAWVLTIVGGYAWRWSWTGYQGNTLWDWLQLLLLPLLVPTILMPTALRWVSGNAVAQTQAALHANTAHGTRLAR